MTADPSPTAIATGFTNTARTSPAANAHGLEVSYGVRPPASLPVCTNPLSSGAIKPYGQSVFGAARTSTESARVFNLQTCPDLWSLIVMFSNCVSPCSSAISVRVWIVICGHDCKIKAQSLCHPLRCGRINFETDTEHDAGCPVGKSARGTHTVRFGQSRFNLAVPDAVARGKTADLADFVADFPADQPEATVRLLNRSPASRYQYGA